MKSILKFGLMLLFVGGPARADALEGAGQTGVRQLFRVCYQVSPASPVTLPEQVVK